MALVCASATSLPGQIFRQPTITRLIEEQRSYVSDSSDEQLPSPADTTSRSIAPARAPVGRHRRISAKGAGLRNDWIFQIVRQAGNDGEVFERNVGTATRLGIPRGLDHLCRRYLLRPTHPLKSG
jgi:general L-amino acid transport system substrate-binding protein